MKTLILLLISLWMGTLPFYAKEGDTTSSTTTTTDTKKTEKKEIPLTIRDKSNKLTYSLVQPTAYAYLYNKVVSVDLSELPGTFTVRVTSLSTGEEVASQTVCGFAEIDLSYCAGGTFPLELVSEDEWLQGEFTL